MTEPIAARRRRCQDVNLQKSVIQNTFHSVQLIHRACPYAGPAHIHQACPFGDGARHARCEPRDRQSASNSAYDYEAMDVLDQRIRELQVGRLNITNDD